MSYYRTTNATYGSFYNEKKPSPSSSYKPYNQNYNNYETEKIQKKEEIKVKKKGEISLKNFIVNSLTGLQNLGNTCYINTCLQNLIHCNAFIEKFLLILESNKISAPISNSFYNLLAQITDNSQFEQKDFINPNNFINIFYEIHNNFERYQEHDTQEFCRYLLQDLNSELNEIKIPSSYKKELPKKNKNKKESFNIYLEDCYSKEKSIITDLFIGYFSFEYYCECGYKEYSFSQFLDLPIQMDINIQGYDLYQMLRNNFYKKSYVDMGENCSFCKRTSKKNEIMKIAKLPKILIISLQRINPKNGMKNEAFVKFYEGLDLKEIIDTEIQNGINTRYDLFAISNHIGNINTGHYYSHIKINNNWYCFEDSKVYKIGTQIDMNTKEVYTLFYKVSN